MVSVTVVDPSGGVIPGAQLKLTDLATNDVRQAVTQDAGNYTFVNLNFGSYKLTVARNGFETQSYNVVVQTARTTDIKATLKVGSAEVVVDVEGGAAPLVETSSSATSITIDTKMIEDLPLGGRNIAQLSRLAAGYNGTWNGLPTMAQGSSMDGIIGVSGRWKYSSGADASAVTPRLENIAEMTVSTDQLDLNSGFGTSNMQITYVTRRGSNAFHGRFYEDFRNDALNANPWRVSKKPKLILNEFGASLGGPIIKDKLFFFASLSNSRQPGSRTLYNQYFTDTARQGIYTAGNGKQVNLFNVAAAYNAANGTNLPTSLNSVIKNRLTEIDGYRASAGSPDPSVQDDRNLLLWQWNQTSPVTIYYPTFRIDYNLSQNLRLNLAYNQTKSSSPGASNAWWPGDGRIADNKSNNLTAALGLEWTISPTLINQLRLGYLYTAAWFGTGGSSDYKTNPTVFWNYGDYEMSGMVYNMPNSRMQPVISMSDSTTWVKGAHTFSFGFNAYRDQNKYWDPPEGFPNVGLGLATGDPALQAITQSVLQQNGITDADELGNAQQLYAVLTGRVDSVWGRHAYDSKTNAYATDVQYSRLNEVMKSWGLFAQDSYKFKPNLTINYGLRWDFVGENKDITGKYHSMTPGDLFGPSGAGNLFQPGFLPGTMDPVLTQRDSAYDPWRVTPQPAIGIAWSPRSSGSWVEKLLGGNGTVVRAGYSLRRFTEPQQFVWDMASAYGAGFYQPFYTNADTSGLPGTFMPGSLQLGAPYPTFVKSPSEYSKVIHLNEATFGDPSAAGIDPKIRQPYTQSWNLGIQRELGATRAIEVRYNGSHTIHQWIAQNINEVNIFENGFLDEFKHAQANYNINKANGVNSFANLGAPGQFNLPIMTAAGVSFTDNSFITNLQRGQAGSFAGTLTQPGYFCNMVGSSFGPCGASAGAGAGYPINFFVANPFATGAWMGAPYMTDKGYSNYNSLQLEFRQRNWHGLTYTANYTWSHTLGVATAGDWMGGYKQETIRDIKSSYGPANTDRQNVVHVNATYDLPFGKGKQWLNSNGIVDKVLGGWTVSSILTWQTGAPFRINGANNTFNNLSDGGVVLNGITAADLQDHVGVFYNAANQVRYLDPTWTAEMFAKGAITSNTTPGEIGQIIYLHGPRQTFTDIGISKSAAITERVKFKFQAELLNAFNHPVFAYSGRSVGSTSGFGSAVLQSGTRPRNIEFRANIEF
ncbi:MAG TPA: TonB-dependent receptor [Clostridia bacterium]|nr:TonB-dependent receptor [Clostridia bacterium]